MELRLKKYEDSPAAREKLFEFYRVSYPDIPEMVIESRFTWQSFQNPLERADEKPLIWILENADNDIVGHNSILKYNLKIGEREYDGYCSTNLIIKPGLEGRRLGHAFIENNENLGGVAYAVGITTAASRAFQKRGWVPVDDARLHALLLKPSRALRFLNRPAWLSYLAAPIIRILNLAVRLIFSFRLRTDPEGLSYREVDRFLPEWDPLWKRYTKKWAIHFSRSSEVLNYKYFGRTDVKHTVILFEKDNQPVGYCVYRQSVSKSKNISLGRIVDIIYNPEIGFRLPAYMVRVAKRRLIGAGIDAIVAVASAPEMARALRLNGLIFSKVQPAIIKEEDFSIKALREEFENIWLITMGDSDMDNYW